MKKIYYTPGPSELYFTYEGHYKNALKNGVGSISHRSKEFEVLYSETVENLKTLLNIPDSWNIVFTSSTNETWERILMNLVENKSFHLVNGAFSKKFYDFSKLLNNQAQKAEVEYGSCVNPKDITIPENTELIGVTLNETSTGATQPLEDIETLRTTYDNPLIAVDAVSIVPYPDINFDSIDMIYFSVQKAFGLPSGLGVWILNERSVEKNIKIEEKGIVTGTYNRLSKMLEMGKKNQTTLTPNVMGIYTLGKIAEDMNIKGIGAIRRETDYKGALLYSTINNHQLLQPFVKDKKYRSVTTIVAEYLSNDSNDLINFLKEKDMIVGNGYGQYKGKHIRIANFPAHSKEQVEMLVDALESFNP